MLPMPPTVLLPDVTQESRDLVAAARADAELLDKIRASAFAALARTGRRPLSPARARRVKARRAAKAARKVNR